MCGGGQNKQKGELFSCVYLCAIVYGRERRAILNAHLSEKEREREGGTEEREPTVLNVSQGEKSNWSVKFV